MLAGTNSNSLFSQTVGGNYQRSTCGKMVSYTFPNNACVEISGVKIPLGGLTVSCSTFMDTVTVKHFSKVTSLISSNKPNSYALDFMLCSVVRYPHSNDFKTYGVEYISEKDYSKFKQQIKDEKLAANH